MQYSLATIFGLVIAAIASPTPGGGDSAYGGGRVGSCGGANGCDVNNNPGEDLKIQHVYSTDASNVILVGVSITPVLNTRILTLNRGINLSSGYGRSIRNDADAFCKSNERVHGVFGCSQSVEVCKIVIES